MLYWIKYTKKQIISKWSCTGNCYNDDVNNVRYNLAWSSKTSTWTWLRNKGWGKGKTVDASTPPVRRHRLRYRVELPPHPHSPETDYYSRLSLGFTITTKIKLHSWNELQLLPPSTPLRIHFRSPCFNTLTVLEWSQTLGLDFQMRRDVTGILPSSS